MTELHVTVDLDDYQSEIFDWIQKNFTLEEVFEEDDILAYVAEGYTVDSVFPDKELREWAEENGYVLGES